MTDDGTRIVQTTHVAHSSIQRKHREIKVKSRTHKQIFTRSKDEDLRQTMKIKGLHHINTWSEHVKFVFIKGPRTLFCTTIDYSWSTSSLPSITFHTTWPHRNTSLFFNTIIVLHTSAGTRHISREWCLDSMHEINSDQLRWKKDIRHGTSPSWTTTLWTHLLIEICCRFVSDITVISMIIIISSMVGDT